ncbi:MAG: hypothetical protein V4760_17825 [Bdellovibrionota bacterium]
MKAMIQNFVSLAALLVASQAIAQQSPGMVGVQKKTVCTATINSTDERESFQKYLHPDYFQFVELVKGKQDVGFLDRSCRKQDLKCDVVLVSGHFGGGFTDNKEFFLALEDMEKTACKSCPSVLGSASMVYLFGCNTLAGKNLDGRSPEEYYRVLVDEVGLDPAEARSTVAIRYSAIGDSFNDRLRRVFRGSSAVGGFNSKAPLGEQIQPSINAFFGTLVKGLKQDGLLEEWERRAISEAFYLDMDRLKQGQTNGSNQAIYESGKRLQPSLASVVGGGYIDVPGIRTGSTEDFVAEKLCSMKGGGRNRLNAIEEIINTGDRISVVQMLPYLLEMSQRGGQSGDQKMFFQRLASNPQLREIMSGQNGIIEQLKEAPEERTRTVDLAMNLGWLTQGQADAYYRQAAVYMWNNSGGFARNKKFLNKMKDDLASVQVGEIESKAFKGGSVWSWIAEQRGSQPEWAALAAQNVGNTVGYYSKKFEGHRKTLANPVLSRDGQKAQREKMNDTKKSMESVCSLIGKIPSLRDQRASLLAPHAQAFTAMGANGCLR